MKVLNSKIAIFFLLVTLISCDKNVLDEQSGDLIIPNTVEHYIELMRGEVFNQFGPSYTHIDILTDEIEGRGLLSVVDPSQTGARYRGYFTWQPEVEYLPDGAYLEDPAWKTIYKTIQICNIILNEALSGNISEQKYSLNQLIGEAYFMRGFAYLILVNLYANPYNESTAESDKGVPINLNHFPVTDQFFRNSVAEVYQQIEGDLQESVTYFKNSTQEKNIFHPSVEASYLLLSRMYTYMEVWDSVVNYSTKVIDVYPLLNQLENSEESPFYHSSNPEIIFSHGAQVGISTTLDVVNRLLYERLSQDLLNLYHDSDFRIPAYISVYSDIRYLNNKRYYAQSNLYDHALRSCEAYFNRAEAYIALSQDDLAYEDIYKIREARFPDTVNHVDLVAGIDVTQLLREEKRREFSFESIRWFDMRRWDRPMVEHIYETYEGTTLIERVKYTLELDDPAYTLQIPSRERELNPDMEINFRPERPGENLLP